MHALNLIRPDLGRRAYRLKCRFVIEAYPTAGRLATVKVEAAERFVEDMAKQGYEYMDKHGVTEPRLIGAVTPITGAPTRAQRERFDAAAALPNVMAGDRLRLQHEMDYAVTIPLLNQVDAWQYEITAVFVHKTLLVETPDDHEERKVLLSR